MTTKHRNKQHTQGEWTWKHEETTNTMAGINIRGKSTNLIICEVHSPLEHANYLESEANAKLIASAPEMLEVLIIVKKHLEKVNDGHCDHRITEVIKKATL